MTDGKAVGTYLEHKFLSHLMDRYSFASGNSALGIDMPSLGVDIKVTSAKQPQSSCPFRSAQQKVFGLGYHLIVFVYEKADHRRKRTSRLTISDVIFVDAAQSGDFQTTKGLLDILDRQGNKDDILAFLDERRLPVRRDRGRPDCGQSASGSSATRVPDDLERSAMASPVWTRHRICRDGFWH